VTKLRWNKADEYVPDPGAAVSVPDMTRPYTQFTAADKARRRKELTEERQNSGEAIRRAEHEALCARHGITPGKGL
jgi:hypothetical protein